MTIAIYRVETQGLYKWGKGMSSDDEQKWNRFWEHLNYRKSDEHPVSMIHYAPPAPNEVSKSGCIYSAGGHAMLHPRGITFVEERFGDTPTDFIHRELKQLFDEVCKLIGGTFTITKRVVEVGD